MSATRVALRFNIYALAFAGLLYAYAWWWGRPAVIAYFACWVLLLPLMLAISYAGGLVMVWNEIADMRRNGWKPPEPMPILSGKAI